MPARMDLEIRLKCSIRFLNELANWNDPRYWRVSIGANGSPGESLDQPVAGDSNRDGVFDSSDLVLVFQTSEFEDGIAMNSSFGTGDWNNDGEFDTADFVFVFQQGTFIRA